MQLQLAVIYNCRPGRCYIYGFPYVLLKQDSLDESGIQYNYARFEDEDAKVVPYNWGVIEGMDINESPYWA